MDERKKKRFLWGLVLAWVPAIPLLFATAHVVRESSTAKATGLGAVAGGLAEAYLNLGVGITLVLEIGAIIFLLQSFSRENLGRAVVSTVSICCSAVVILVFGLFIWFYVLKAPYAS